MAESPAFYLCQPVHPDLSQESLNFLQVDLFLLYADSVSDPNPLSLRCLGKLSLLPGPPLPHPKQRGWTGEWGLTQPVFHWVGVIGLHGALSPGSPVS